MMPPQVVAFADLDDTLFQTLRKLPGADRETLQPATVDTRGEAHSYCTPAQWALIQHLTLSGATIIPVTGRDQAAFGRVTLPFPSWRVLDHGLTILTPQGEPEPQWTAQVRGHLHTLRQTLEDGTAHILPHAQRLGCRLTRHAAHDLPFMTVLKHPDADQDALAEAQVHWEEWLTREGGAELQVIANANNVSLLPASLGKAQAVTYLRQTYFSGAALVLGLGDSLSDVAFLNVCDFALTPPQGQLLRSVTAARLPQR
ncbi:hypothetical protein MF271_18290 (plasmid) [Deinococcus sp. KNUC1210]|uniref:hypothetical protein n=1 Tax=Deinococcus sp. KNUC1210 TaxID=2917691 RepID=UPI001EF0ACC2|nr:hypothetical protein [Deinococcus sp. KNUC1210]ULH17304.1 hypothetical protein MF271_18290 [Deinococcus sp. KNUC1210]